VWKAGKLWRSETVLHTQAPQTPEISVPFTEISGSGVLEFCLRFGAISFSPADNFATSIQFHHLLL